MDMGSSPSPPAPPVLEGRRALEGDEERVRSRAEVARKEEPRRDSAFTGSCGVENETWYVSVYERGHRSNTEEELELTAYLTPTIQLPPMTSPFFRTARIASAGFLYPILKQLMISVLGSASVQSPKCLKYSAVTLYLSAG